MLDTTSLLSVVIAFFIVTVSPGPANIAVATVAMSSGRKNGLIFAFGLSVGLMFWGVVAATGLGALLQGSAKLLVGMKVLGGVYLLWLAYQSARSAFTSETRELVETQRSSMFRHGLLLNLTNPKAVVAWMAALSMGLGSADNDLLLVASTLVCMALGLLNYLGHALVFSVTGAMTAYKRLRRVSTAQWQVFLQLPVLD